MTELEKLREENKRLRALVAAIGDLCGNSRPKDWTDSYECRRAATEAAIYSLLVNFLCDKKAILSVLGELEAITKARCQFRSTKEAQR